ncbi:MAG: hypothetical protein AAFQ47_13995 [Pseudomonadota bacterium]
MTLRIFSRIGCDLLERYAACNGTVFIFTDGAHERLISMEATSQDYEQIVAVSHDAMVTLNAQLMMWMSHVNRALQQLEDDPAAANKQISEGLREIYRTRQMLLHERDRNLEAFHKEQESIQHDVIDLETERISIAGKLDRLRAASAADGVSG